MGQHGALEGQRQAAQEALNREKLEVLAGINYVNSQLAALDTDVLQTALGIYNDLDEVGQRGIDTLQDSLEGMPPFTTEDLPAWEQLTNAAINLVDLLGDIIPIGMRVAAFSWGMGDLVENVRELEAREAGLGELDRELAEVGQQLDEAEAALDACREATGAEPCAVCHRLFDDSELRECQGCGALFCEGHYNEAIERHELLHGVSYSPGE